jgi:hypothetical protein
MNKILQDKVKGKCKDMGLSEEYVSGITEKLGGTVADDSTDETAIETVANQIVEIARLSQGEATRWVNKNKLKNEPPKQDPPKQDPPKQDPPKQDPPKTEDVEEAVNKALAGYTKTYEERLKALEQQNANLLAERAKAERQASINAAYKKHDIPDVLREYVAVPDSVEAKDIDSYVAGMSQKLVTLQLPKLHGGIKTGAGEVTKEQTDAIAKTMLPGMATKKKEE